MPISVWSFYTAVFNGHVLNFTDVDKLLSKVLRLMYSPAGPA